MWCGAFDVRVARVAPLTVAVFCVALVTLCSSARAHENSRSRSLLVVEPGQLVHFVKVQAQSVWEVLPLDPDGNLLVEADEFEAVRDDLGRYVMEHVRLRPDGGEPLKGALVSGELVSDDMDALSFEQWIELELRYELAVLPRDLDIEVSLFLETSPRHQDLCDVIWSDEPGVVTSEPVRLSFWAGDPRQVASSRRPLPTPTVLSVLWAGALALLRDPLALLCLAALLAGSAAATSTALARTSSTKVVLAFVPSLGAGVATAELLAGQLTLGAVTLAGGLAVAWVGALNLGGWARKADAGVPGRPVWAEALVFGLLMGLGLDAMVSPASPWWQLAIGAIGAACAAGLAGVLLRALLCRARSAGLLVSVTAIAAGGWAAFTAL